MCETCVRYRPRVQHARALIVPANLDQPRVSDLEFDLHQPISARYLAGNPEARIANACGNADDESGGLRSYTGAYKILRNVAKGGRSWGWAAGKALGRLAIASVCLGSPNTEESRLYELSLREILAGRSKHQNNPLLLVQSSD